MLAIFQSIVFNGGCRLSKIYILTLMHLHFLPEQAGRYCPAFSSMEESPRGSKNVGPERYTNIYVMPNVLLYE